MAQQSTSPRPAAQQISFTKGHGTGNDFILIADPEGALPMSPERVARLCHRRFGIGADGLILAVRTANMPEADRARLSPPEQVSAEWFMDYRNSDGSVSEMCGNGVRVFAEFLRSADLADFDAEGKLPVATRAGVKVVTAFEPPRLLPNATQTQHDQEEAELAEGARFYSVDMGPWAFIDAPVALANGADALVKAAGLADARPAVSVDMGNPHTVVALGTEAELEALDLSKEPAVSPLPPAGTNVEFIVADTGGDHDPTTSRLRMRVHERGSGETLSCGTGVCATVVATRFWAGIEPGSPMTWEVAVDGGTLWARFEDAIEADGSAREHIVLSGPAELIANGTVWI